jgi:uncharacterized protein YecT (DUF1311 family)
LAAGCSSPQLSQGTLPDIAQKPSTSTSLSPLSAQSATAAVLPATLVTSTQPAAQSKDCNTSQSTTQINECAQLATSTADKQLDQVYQKLVSQLGGASREKLINSQLAWTSFVEAQCGFETRGFDKGTQLSPFHDRCLERLTQQRTQELKSFLASN